MVRPSALLSKTKLSYNNFPCRLACLDDINTGRQTNLALTICNRPVNHRATGCCYRNQARGILYKTCENKSSAYMRSM
mgnify:CR=1 FL=1